ncbi:MULTISPECIES: M23 family metallopeptidase [Brachybacterium]|uniref:M23 family peptidase n=2 Tax=Brachybacterium TaxID=43668 RepID=A0A3R8RY33_9MICO|nr:MULTISPECIES: M23 family metallopeptidase [Brachybacterium]MCT1435755.1 M23 family metallopeptidase [Brachybacterium paraconglomeratum]RRR18465.1 M23 family peptidase [Brachybacterium paraconglomeratum]GLI30109.1 metalloendopeptidase [Brachybacterium conglomeratum]GLK04647.1 metalloendopeptidase [Brachybacterium conglomeratum]
MPSLLRLSGPALGLGAVLIIVTVSLGRGIGPAYLLGVALVVLSLVGQFLQTRLQRPTQEQDPVAVAVPVRGRWRGLNSPASSVPSHTHRLAQTYALDITHEPEGASPRALDPFWAPMRRPEGFPSFGQEVLAPFDGEVIAVHGTSRDHLSRLSLPGIAYLLLEGFVRSLGSPRHLLGNHVMVRAAGSGAAHDDEGSDVPAGTVAVLAHLRRGSPTVQVGERVRAGQVLGQCGNSGNSSDPHVHVQLMDGSDISTAKGVPFTWRYLDEEGAVHTGVPANEELFTAVAEGASH